MIPSPTIATTRPSRCSRSISAAFPSGSTPASDALDADLGGDLVGARGRVAGEHDRRRARAPRSSRTASALVGFTTSRTSSTARGSPSQATWIPPASRPTETSWPSTTPGHAASGLVPEARDGRQVADLGARRPRDRLGDRMLGGRLDRSGEPQHLGARRAVQERDSRELQLPLGDRARLVEHDRVDAPRPLEHLRPLDQHAELRAAPGADHERDRRREAERARAGDDQDGDRRGEGVLAPSRPRRASPTSVSSESDDHGRDEDRRHAVGEPLHGRLARLRRVDESGDPRKRGVGADARRAHDEPPVVVDGRAGDLAPGARPRPGRAHR